MDVVIGVLFKNPPLNLGGSPSLLDGKKHEELAGFKGLAHLRWNGRAYKQGCGMQLASGELCLYFSCDLLRFSTESEQDPVLRCRVSNWRQE
jgi:hypothetical protein